MNPSNPRRRGPSTPDESFELPLSAQPGSEDFREDDLPAGSDKPLEAGPCPINDFATAVLPENLEPRYAYPLVVWLTGRECAAAAAIDHITELSPQNYVGLVLDECSFHTPEPDTTPSLDAPVEFLRRLAEVENRIVTSVRTLRAMTCIHPDRIFLAGVDEAASAALLIAMHQPDWFAGCLCFGGWFPPPAELLARRKELAGRRFWLGTHDGRNLTGSVTRLRHMARQLVSCGADVSLRLDQSDHSVTSTMLREIDEWIISGILAGKL